VVASVDQFMYEHSEELKTMRGYKHLVNDIKTKYGQGGSADIINSLAAKLILSHHYDGVTEQPMAKLFKAFVIKNSEFMGGYENLR